MLYKPLTESAELQILRILNNRMDLPDKDKQHYFNLKKGYEGEVMFDAWLEKLQCECFILNDLLLKMNNTTFQIDSLLITSETIYFFEVKNFEGDYYYDSDSDRLYKKSNSEVNNPLTQLKRSESLLRQLVRNLGYNLPIDASVVFINPEFTLYQAPLHLPFVFPTQVNSYIKKLNTISSNLNGKHMILADKLISLHIDNSPFMQVPPFNENQLKKGCTCVACKSFSVSVEGRKVVCKECGYNEVVAAAVMRSVEELKLLFPNGKITTNIIHEWCKLVNSKKRIKRILEKNFKMVGVRQWSSYE